MKRINLTVLATDSWSQVIIGILIPQIQRLKHDERLIEPVIFGTAALTAAEIQRPEAPVILTQFQVDFKNIELNDLVINRLKTK
jgi:hypothetical protein